MEIKIAGHTVKRHKTVNVNLKYDSIASTFNFLLYFDPNNAVHKKIFRPGAFHTCTVRHQGVLLLTGKVLSVKFLSAGEPPKTLVSISGYSLTGVLEDCPCVTTPLQNDGLTFKQICETVCRHYGIQVIVDDEVAEECDTVIPSTTPEPDEPVREYLDKLASHLNVVLSHNQYGNLLLTKVKSDKLLTTKTTLVNTTPVPVSDEIAGAPEDTTGGNITTASDRATLYDFDTPGQWINMEMCFDGQAMHSDIVVVAQDDVLAGANAIESDPLINPYYTNDDSNNKVYSQVETIDNPDNRGARPLTVIQKTQVDTSDNKAPKTARSVLNDELKRVTLVVDVDRWVLKGNIITPNQMITAKNPECYLYKRTDWFVQEVALFGDEQTETAKLMCVPPPAFGTDEVVNIFE